MFFDTLLSVKQVLYLYLCKHHDTAIHSALSEHLPMPLTIQEYLVIMLRSIVNKMTETTLHYRLRKTRSSKVTMQIIRKLGCGYEAIYADGSTISDLCTNVTPHSSICSVFDAMELIV
jgi:hypothetical protein